MLRTFVEILLADLRSQSEVVANLSRDKGFPL